MGAPAQRATFRVQQSLRQADVGQDAILRGGCQPPLSLYYAKLELGPGIFALSGREEILVENLFGGEGAEVRDWIALVT